jgi:protein SCO1
MHGFLLLLGSLVLLVVLGGCSSSPSRPALVGTNLRDLPAPSFTLKDQNGTSITLDALRGRVTALTFLYTHCRTLRPVIAGKLRAATQRLASQGNRAVVIAISTDPFHDTAASARAFLRELRVASRWHFLLGNVFQLTPRWARYHVYAGPAGKNGQLAHTAGIYLIDRHGRERVYLGATASETAIVSDMSSLIAET